MNTKNGAVEGASTSTQQDDEVPADREARVPEDYADLVDALGTIMRNAPEDENQEAWVQHALELCNVLQSDRGRLYKKTARLSSKASEVGWTKDNSVTGIVSFDPDYYENGRGNLRRGKTEVRMGSPVTKAAKICSRKGIAPGTASKIAKVEELKRPTATAQATATTWASTNEGLTAQVREVLHQEATSSGKYSLDHLSAHSYWSETSSPLMMPTGIEGATCEKSSSKAPDLQKLTAKNGSLLSTKQVGNAASNQVDTAPEPPLIVRKALKRQTCERETIQAIYDHVPESKENKVLFRWIVYALWTNWRDELTNNRVIHHRIMDWIGCYRFDSAWEVLAYIKEHLPIEHSDTWAEGSHTRQILYDGLPTGLWKAVQMDLDTPPSDYDTRVYVLNGRVVTMEDPAKRRKELREEIRGMGAPSPTARRIWRRMNDLPARRFSRFQDRIGEALEHVDRMEIDVGISPLQKKRFRDFTGCEKDEDTGELSGNVVRYKARVRLEKRKKAKEQREEYKKILHRIALQHKPFYGFSRQERTDRIFSHNDSALLLPSEVRDILCEGLYDVDLKSAHLFIAAWLWGAEAALETLTQEGYSIWDDLMAHCEHLFEENGLEVPEKGDRLYDEVKAGMKIMVYSTVYGMDKSAIQAEVTKSLQSILGPEVGDHLTSHPVIADIRKKRDEILADLEPGDTLRAPSGIEIEVEVGLENEGEEGYKDLVGPKSAVATQAQAYEQELMSVLLEVAEERDRFRLMLWLHDGAVCKARHPNAVETAVNEALDDKRRELTAFAGKDTLLPAIFEVERIEAPDLPPKDVHERIASAGGGALRLKEGETAVKVDPDTGEELGPADGQMLLKREHELYEIAGTYVRITDDGYSMESDPFPEDKLWQKLDSSASSTSSTTPRDQNEKSVQTDQSESPKQTAGEGETAPGAGSRSSEEERSPDSATSTTSALPVCRDGEKAPDGESVAGDGFPWEQRAERPPRVWVEDEDDDMGSSAEEPQDQKTETEEDQHNADVEEEVPNRPQRGSQVSRKERIEGEREYRRQRRQRRQQEAGVAEKA